MSLKDQIDFVRYESDIRRGLIGVQKYSANRPPVDVMKRFIVDESIRVARKADWIRRQRPRIKRTEDTRTQFAYGLWVCQSWHVRPTDGMKVAYWGRGDTPHDAYEAWAKSFYKGQS